MKYRITAHARERMEQASIPEDLVRQTLEHPDGRIWDESAKYIYQKVFQRETGRRFLLRVVDEAQVPVSVVTIYAASRYHRYLR